MAELLNNVPENPIRVFYRRVKPDYWRDGDPSKPDDTAFYLRDGERGLSVFDAARATPEQLLQYQIEQFEANGQRKRLAELQEKGGGVAGMLAIGWGVVEITEDEFTRRGFVPGRMDARGHLEVYGSQSEYMEAAPDFVTACRRCL